MTKKTGVCALAALLTLATASHAQTETPSNEELYRIIERQQAQIDALAGQADESQPAGRRVDVSGYGELHYNNNKDGDDQVDFHRFVLMFGYEFNDDVRLFTELEVEHALSGDGKPGEVELEQAWLEFDLGERHAARAGLDLIPVGILNETHEPNTFYGVERNRVESQIIPATWWAAGARLIGRPTARGLSYDLFVHEGLAMDAAPDFSIRDGRQKTAKALANDIAVTGRLKYTGIPGLELAGSLQYQGDVTQAANDGLDAGLLYEAHVVYSSGPFGLRALYAQWDIDGPLAEANGRDSQFGWYVEPSFKFHPQFGVFARYAELEETEDLSEENVTVGLNYWPIEQLVFKADYQQRETEQAGGGSVDADSFNLGVGYVFP